MPTKVYLLPEPGDPISLPRLNSTSIVARIVERKPLDGSLYFPRVEYLARILEAVPDDWSDVSGLLDAPAPDSTRDGAAVSDTGYQFHRFDACVRVVARAGHDSRPDLAALIAGGRPPDFVSFQETGLDAPWQFQVAKKIAAGLLRRGYAGWLTLNNGRDREYDREKPAEVEIFLRSWRRSARVVEIPQATPPAVVLRWSEEHGGHSDQLASVEAVCRRACRELPADE